MKEHNGYFPVKIESLAEGSVIYPHVPVYQITAKGKYSRLVTYLETLLTMIWVRPPPPPPPLLQYPCTVATLSRRIRSVISEYFELSVDPSSYGLLNTRLHDFGFRGCTSVEQSVIGGISHLVLWPLPSSPLMLNIFLLIFPSFFCDSSTLKAPTPCLRRTTPNSS